MRFAFIGFRHGHIMGFYKAARDDARVKVVGASEDHKPTADELRAAGTVALTHDNYRRMLEEVDCDAVAVGDYFARRGEIVIAALEAGKHVIADKPICTSLGELDRIEKLCKEKSRQLSALLDLRDSGALRTMRRLIGEGLIGEVHTANFTAQHPLFLGKRAAWYFEEGKHGGTLNDIGIHATDLIPWMTGLAIKRVVAGRAWNARVPQFPHFQDAGQLMLELDNGGGVLGDVSYLAPDGIAYSAPQYWRITCHGSDGVLEGNYGARQVYLATRADKAVRTIEAEADDAMGRLNEFLAAVNRSSAPGSLGTAELLTASRAALTIQQCADRGAYAADL
jgi:predicted dehydrogenase